MFIAIITHGHSLNNAAYSVRYFNALDDATNWFEDYKRTQTGLYTARSEETFTLSKILTEITYNFDKSSVNYKQSFTELK